LVILINAYTSDISVTKIHAIINFNSEALSDFLISILILVASVPIHF